MLPALIRAGTAEEPPTLIPPPGAPAPVVHAGTPVEASRPTSEDNPLPPYTQEGMAAPRITCVGSHTYTSPRSEEDKDAELAEAMEKSWNMSHPKVTPANGSSNPGQHKNLEADVSNNHEPLTAHPADADSTAQEQTNTPAERQVSSAAVDPVPAEQASPAPPHDSDHDHSNLETTATSDDQQIHPATEPSTGREVVPSRMAGAGPNCFRCGGDHRVRDVVPAHLCQACAHQGLAVLYDHFLDQSGDQVGQSDRLGFMRRHQRRLRE